MFAGSLLAWTVYSLVVAKNWQRITGMPILQRGLEHLHHLSQWKVFARIRRSIVNKNVLRVLLQIARILVIGIGVFLIARGGSAILSDLLRS